LQIGPEHVLASGSMPPGFPGVRIDGDLYWDGGCVSNTPLDGIFDAQPVKDTLVFMIDLFNPTGKEPEDLNEVRIRHKELMYISRSMHRIGDLKRRQKLMRALHHLLTLIPDQLKENTRLADIEKMASDSMFDVVQIIYNTPSYEVATRDAEFSKLSIRQRAEVGYSDMKKIVKERPWRDHQPGDGSDVFQFKGSTPTEMRDSGD
ncbi:MAG: hypothetical protein HC880_22300, partial [Bacteroidia bacterium]|nr:hypothetical protein [Bacteroidia bacterium]